MRSKVYVKVPASTANMGPGFDSLGMALDLFAWIEMSFAEKAEIRLYGNHLEGIPVDRSNLVYEAAQLVLSEAGFSQRELDIAVYSEIPLTRGLGSSASAIVGGLLAANELCGNPLSRDRIFQLAARMEDHPDNVGASLFGGIVAALWTGEEAQCVRIQPGEELEILAVIPDYKLSTKQARNVLPMHVSLQDAVYNVGHSSVLVAALATGQYKVIRSAMRDRLHQPYRASLIPGMGTILANAADHGALGVALSGAGPTLIALVERNSPFKSDLETYLVGTLKRENISARAKWLKPCAEGALILTHFDKNCTLIENIKGEIRA